MLLNRRLLLCAALPLAACAASHSRPLSGSAEGGTVKVLLDRYVADRKLAGAVAVIGTMRGPQFVSSGRLALDETASSAAPDSLWRIYSLTKLVTGAAAMLLVEDGRISLETPVSDIFPAFASPQVLVSPGSSQTRPATAPITVRHLMTHTSGLVGSRVPEPPLSTFYLDRRLNVSRVSFDDDANARHQSSLLAFGAAAGTVPLAFDPGSQWSYGISSDVLGAVVEQVSGTPFERFLQTRIFDPLDMRDTDFVVSSDKLNRLSTNYQVSAQGLNPVDAPPRSIFAESPPFPFPSSGLVSSAHDYARFMGMLLGEGALDRARVMRTQTARLMMSNLLPDGVSAAGGQGWGAGGSVLLAGADVPTPLGMTSGAYGWQGGAGTVAWVDRTTGIYAILMSQYMPTEAYPLPMELTAAILTERTR